MKVHIIKPYSLTKNLGQAYNEAMSLIPQTDWACLMDYDTMFLTSDCGAILHEYARRAIETIPATHAPLMTCYTNRINPRADHQLLNGECQETDSIKIHLGYASARRLFLYQTTELKRVISGFLMLVHRQTWDALKFSENMKCLGVDNDYSQRILESGRKILRMEGLYIWHTYRLGTGINDKTHLL